MLAIFSALLFSGGYSNSPEMTVLGQSWKQSHALESEQCPCGFPSLFLFKSPKSNLLCLQSWALLRLWAMSVLKPSEVTSVLLGEHHRQWWLMSKTGCKPDTLNHFKNCCRSIFFFFPLLTPFPASRFKLGLNHWCGLCALHPALFFLLDHRSGSAIYKSMICFLLHMCAK